ncbi:MAG: glycosyltransferase [Pseudomonadota bacterium]
MTGLYPPNAPTATVRAPKFARYLLDRGHDVRVLAAQNLQFPAAVDPEIDDGRITHVPYIRRGRTAPMTEADQPRPDGGSGNGAGGNGDSGMAQKVGRLRYLVRRLQHLPDPHVTWIAPAVAAGGALAAEWRPDVLFSTGPPDSSHIVAARLSRRLGVPFVAELRDLWSDNIYNRRRVVVEAIERVQELATLRRAAGIVAVTEGAAERLAARYDAPVVQAANGYDPADFAGLETVEQLDAARLSIVHAGSTYGGRRSPEPLFAALAAMGEAADGIVCHFYGEDIGPVRAFAEAAGVGHLVETHGPVGRKQVLEIERRADVLLLLRFATEGEKHVVAGKLYEYAGARRPILCHGQMEGEAAEIIRGHDLGLVSNDPQEIADWLRARFAEREEGRLPDLPAGAAESLTRSTQFAKVERLLSDVAQT